MTGHSNYRRKPRNVYALCPKCSLCEKCARAIEYGITPREIDIVKGVSEGLTSPQIATQLDISDETVKRHLTNIFNKFGVDTRTGMMAFAVRHGMIDL